jgi:hypothetical protein
MGVRAGGRDRRVFCVRAHAEHARKPAPLHVQCVCLNQIHRVHRYSSAPIARGTFEAPWPVNHPSASLAVTSRHMHHVFKPDLDFTSARTCPTSDLDEHAAT